MNGLNQVQLIGNLGKDPELKYTQTGTAICSFSVAINKKWITKDGEKGEHTEWVNVTAFRKLAEICGEWLKQGQTVFVQGSLNTSSYEDKDGVKRKSTNVIADRLIMLGGGKNRDSGAGEDSVKDGGTTPTTSGKDGESDLPF